MIHSFKYNARIKSRYQKAKNEKQVFLLIDSIFNEGQYLTQQVDPRVKERSVGKLFEKAVNIYAFDVLQIDLADQ